MININEIPIRKRNNNKENEEYERKKKELKEIKKNLQKNNNTLLEIYDSQKFNNNNSNKELEDTYILLKNNIIDYKKKLYEMKHFEDKISSIILNKEVNEYLENESEEYLKEIKLIEKNINTNININKELEKEIIQLKEIFIELNNIAYKQGEMLKLIEDNIEETKIKTLDAENNIIESNNLINSILEKKFLIFSIISIGVCASLGIPKFF